jgi:hypothetical protein
MSENTNIKLPPTGWRFATDPCAECLIIVEFESQKVTWPGRQVDCYNCANRLTAVRTEKQGPSAHDRYSSLASYDESIREYKLTEIMFARKRFSTNLIERWLIDRELANFEKSGSKGIDWDVFTKSTDSEACVLVMLGDGIIGRCVLDVAAV